MKDIQKAYEEFSFAVENSVIKGDFEVTKVTEHLVYLKLCDNLEIKFWIANDPKNHFRVYDFDFILNNIFKTQDTRIRGYKMVKPFILKHKKEVLLKQKKGELSLLKSSIQEIESYVEKNK